MVSDSRTASCTTIAMIFANAVSLAHNSIMLFISLLVIVIPIRKCTMVICEYTMVQCTMSYSQSIMIYFMGGKSDRTVTISQNNISLI